MSYNLIDQINRYESSQLSDDEIVELFQYLLDTGIIHHLQGHYQRTACDLLTAGFIHS